MSQQPGSEPIGAVVGAVVMAAGLSRRMGQPKLVMPWGQTTVIGRVVEVLFLGGAEEIVVVTGGSRLLVEAALSKSGARTAFNAHYENGEMLASLQTGLASLSPSIAAALVALGDQPQIESAVVSAVIGAYRQRGSRLVTPSYQMRRGHPWLIERSLWPELLALASPQTLRDFLVAHAAEIEYLLVDTPSILMDLDTPEDYQAQRPSQ